MGMVLKIGKHSLDSDSVTVDQRTVGLIASGVKYGYQKLLIIDGFISGDGADELTRKTTEFESALLVRNPDIILYTSTSAKSATHLINAQAANSVLITSGPNWRYGEGEYATVRRFSIEAIAEYYTPAFALGGTIEFHETINFTGGGPKYVTRPCLNGPPQRQLVYKATPYIAVITGRAIGVRKYPRIPPSLWPYAEDADQRKTSRDGPDVDGKNKKNWIVSWEYVHSWPSPLIGAPRSFY